MDTIGAWPYLELSFNASGARLGSGPIRPGNISDLVVISHGWHMDAQPARVLYDTLLTKVAKTLPAARSVGVVGVFWPADEFNDDLSHQVAAPGIGGGGAALAGVGDIPPELLVRRVRQAAAFLGDNPQAMLSAAQRAVAGGAEADAFVDRLRGLVHPNGTRDPQLLIDHQRLLSNTPGRQLLQDWSKAPPPPAPPGPGGGAGFDFSAPFEALYHGLRSGVVTALNTASYFEMKRRAGDVGAALGKLLEVDGLHGVRLHLIGHSFGARLVTAAADTLSTVRAQSLTLLQGAFSHNALGVGVPGVGDGFYRGVIAHGRVAGPITITHTWRDSAVGFWYPLASRASNTVAAGVMWTNNAFGGAGDLHGGMGSNGALRLQANEGSDQAYTGMAAPPLAPGRVNSLKCDFITEHGDVANDGCGRIVAQAMA